MFNCKGTLSFLTTAILLFLAACTSVNNHPLSVNRAPVTNTVKANLNQVIIADLDSSIKGANISIKMDFIDFSTKGNENGIAPKLISDIASAKLYLTTSASDPLDSASIKFTSSVLVFSGTAKTYTFANVPPGGPYFVAVELFDASSVNIIEPINYGSGTTTGARGITVSGAPYASVTVNGNAVVSHNDSLTIFPVLAKGTGATIGTDIAPQNGSYSGTVTAN